MAVSQNILYKDGVSTPLSISPNEMGCALEIEISGATAISGYFEGMIDSIYAKLSAFNYSTVEFKPEFTSNGIYSIGTMGFINIRAVVESATGSPVITGRIIR